MHSAVADGRNRFSGMSLTKLDSEVKERALTANENECPRCSAWIWPEGNFLFCPMCGWMQENDPPLMTGFRRGFIDYAYAGWLDGYKDIPLRTVITDRPSGHVKITYSCPLFVYSGPVRSEQQTRCSRETKRNPHGLRNYKGKLVLYCPVGHKVVLSGITWTLLGEQAP